MRFCSCRQHRPHYNLRTVESLACRSRRARACRCSLEFSARNAVTRACSAAVATCAPPVLSPEGPGSTAPRLQSLLLAIAFARATARSRAICRALAYQSSRVSLSPHARMQQTVGWGCFLPSPAPRYARVRQACIPVLSLNFTRAKQQYFSVNTVVDASDSD
jgi:hypothetical protein